mgnify:CR=1 FL=1
MSENSPNQTKSPKKASHEEVLIPIAKAKVTYGGKEYEIYPLSVKGILKIVRIVASQFAKMNNEGVTDNASALLSMLESLDEEAIYDLVGTILNLEKEEVKTGFRTADALSVISASFELEDVQQIFFQINKMIKAL